MNAFLLVLEPWFESGFNATETLLRPWTTETRPTRINDPRKSDRRMVLESRMLALEFFNGLANF